MATNIQGKILTVTGAIEPADLGKTLIHEHLFFDLTCYFRPPEDERGKSLVDEPLQLSNMGWLRQNVMSSRPNLLMDDASVVEAEVGKYHDLPSLSHCRLDHAPNKEGVSKGSRPSLVRSGNSHRCGCCARLVKAGGV